MKFRTITLRMEEELYQLIEAKRGDLDRSKFLRNAIESSLQGQITARDAVSPSIIVELTESLCGALDAQDMAAKLGAQNQPRKLREMLIELLNGDTPQPWEGLKPMTEADVKGLKNHVEKPKKKTSKRKQA